MDGLLSGISLAALAMAVFASWAASKVVDKLYAMDVSAPGDVDGLEASIEAIEDSLSDPDCVARDVDGTVEAIRRSLVVQSLRAESGQEADSQDG